MDKIDPIRLVDEMNSYGVPAKPSGFPLYLFPLRSKRMPLQSLTREALQNLMALPILINKVYFFWRSDTDADVLRADTGYPGMQRKRSGLNF